VARLARQFVKKQSGRAALLDAEVDLILSPGERQLIEQILARRAEINQRKATYYAQLDAEGHKDLADIFRAMDEREVGVGSDMFHFNQGARAEQLRGGADFETVGKNRGLTPGDGIGSTGAEEVGGLSRTPFGEVIPEAWDEAATFSRLLSARAAREPLSFVEAEQVHSDALYRLDRLYEQGVLDEAQYDGALREWRSWRQDQQNYDRYSRWIAGSNADQLSRSLELIEQAWRKGKVTRKQFRDLVARSDERWKELGTMPGGHGYRPAHETKLRGTQVTDEKGRPLVVYRGEHGASGQLETRRASYSFGRDPETANTYAMDPNNLDDVAEAPRVTPAYLRLRNPFIDNPNDPFVEFSEIAAKLGPEEAKRIALRHTDDIADTAPFHEGDFGYMSVEEVIEKHGLDQLYMKAFRLFDDPEAVAAMKARGYDGGIHGGFGDNADDLEYKVFDPDQIIPAIAAKGEKPQFQTMAERLLQRPGQGQRMKVAPPKNLRLGARGGFAATEVPAKIAQLTAAGGLASYGFADTEEELPFQPLARLGAFMFGAKALGGFKNFQNAGQLAQRGLDAGMRQFVGETRSNRAMRWLFDGYGLPEGFNALRNHARRDMAQIMTETTDTLRKMPDLTPEQQTALAEVLKGRRSMQGALRMLRSTPIYQRYIELGRRLTATGLSKGQRQGRYGRRSIEDFHRQVVVGELMQAVAANPEWVMTGPNPRQVKQARELAVRAKLRHPDDLARAIDVINRNRTAHAVRELRKTHVLASDMKKGALNKGPLKDKWVRRDIAEEIVRIYEMPERIRQFSKNLQKLHTTWKRFHTVDNPGTHTTNVIANLITGHISGSLPWEDPRTWRAMRESSRELIDWLTKGTESPDIAEAMKHGMLAGDSHVMQEFQRIAAALHNEDFGSPNAVLRAFGMAGEKLGDLGRFNATVYQLEEQIMKLAVVKRTLARGGTVADGVAEAEKWFFDYGQTSPLIDDLRTQWWGFPFITWSAKMAPRMLEMATENPMRVMSTLALMSAATQVGMAPELNTEELPWWLRVPGEAYERGRSGLAGMFGAMPDRAQLPPELQPRFPGDVRAVNKAGPGEDPNLVRVGKYLPAPFLEGGSTMGERALNTASDFTGILGGPLWKGFTETMLNRHIDRGEARQPIYDEAAPLQTKVGQWAGHQAKEWLPPLVGGRAWERITGTEPWRQRALERGDESAQPGSMISRAMGGVLGITDTGPMTEPRLGRYQQQNVRAAIERATYSLDRAIEQAAKAEDYDTLDRLVEQKASVVEDIMRRYGF
jgi:hypothetical protein